MLRTSLVLGLALLGAITSVRRADAQRPNIVFIMADDLGNADLGYRGGEIKSPNIDKLAKEGVRLEFVLWRTGLYPLPRGIDDWPVSHAIRTTDAGDLSKPHLRPGHR